MRARRTLRSARHAHVITTDATWPRDIGPLTLSGITDIRPGGRRHTIVTDGVNVGVSGRGTVLSRDRFLIAGAVRHFVRTGEMRACIACGSPGAAPDWPVVIEDDTTGGVMCPVCVRQRGEL